MANDQFATVKVAVPQAGQREVYYVKPKDVIDLSHVNMADTRVDLLGADVVMTNTKTGATVVLAQAALYLFDKNDAPTLLGANGHPFSPETMLSHIGKVWEFTARDYLGITSLEKSSPTESDKQGQAQGQGGPALSDKVQAVEAAAASTKPVTQNSPAEPQPLNEDHKKFDALLQLPEIKTSDGMFNTPPRVAVDVPKTPPDAPGSGNGLTFTFDALLLQPGRSDSDLNSTTGQVLGGGAFETAVFDSRNVAQFSQEIIDVSAGSKSAYTIYADDPANFTDTTATRILELTPYLPDGFSPSEIKISGLPVGFSVNGATYDAGTASWILTNPTLNNNGLIDLSVVYPTASSTSFSLTINFKATFDASTGLSTPATGEIAYTISRDVDVKTVSSAADGNYTDGSGHLVWVMAQNENGTKILGGDKTITVYGGKGADEVYAGSGDDTLYGNKGDDILSGGAGNDFLQGGDGNDILLGGAGTDTADYTDKTVSVSIDLAALTDGQSTAYVNGVAEDTLQDIENINGGSGNDTLLGDAGANVLNGGDGNDILEGRGGNDTLIGGNGTDTVTYEYATTGITVALSGGAATVTVNAGDIDTLSGIENITGTAYADTLTGDTNANVLDGGDGNDTFYFSLGADTIIGGSGTDTLNLSPATSGATLDLGTVSSGYSTLTVGAVTQNISGIENITGTSYADTLTGDAGNNVIDGGSGNDTINGGDGNDTLYGSAGNDTIDGGNGNDTIYGGTGSDTLHGGAGTDTLRFDDLSTAVTVTMSSAGAGTAVSNGETDTFDGFETIYLSAQNDTFTESTGVDIVYGGNGNDTFIMAAGDSSNDTFDGGSGTDTLDYSAVSANMTVNLSTFVATGLGTDIISGMDNVIGGSGNDTIIDNLSFGNTYDGGTGSNTLSYTNLTSALVANLSTVNGSGYSSFTENGYTDLVKNFTTIIGGSGADTFTGNSSNNIFYGGSGNDTFYASDGNDTFYGEAGTDTVNYGTRTEDITATLDASGNATVTFSGISKVDTLYTMENLTGGSGADHLTGNASDNVLSGGAGNDTIYAGDGNDTIYGGDGNDMLYGEAGNDTFYGDLGDDTIDGGTGTNTLNYSNVSGGLTIHADTGTATGGTIGTDTFTNIQKFYGSTGNDNFYGTTGNDNFDGQGGADYIWATNGNDTYTNVEYMRYDSYNARVVANMATGIVQKDIGNDGTIDYTDTYTNNPSQFWGYSYGDTVTGNDYNNYLYLNNGDDTAYASKGSDYISGGSGTDSMYYTNISGTISANLTTSSVTKSLDSSVDTLNSVEKIYAGSGNDTFLTNNTAFTSYTTLDGGTGTDTIQFTSGTLTKEASDFASVFKNMEVLDLRNATLAGGDTFNITTNDVIGLTSSSRTLSMYVTSGFSTTVAASSGYTLASHTTSGNTDTYVFTKSGETNTTLNILTYS